MIETCVRTYAADERAALTGRWAWGGGAAVLRLTGSILRGVWWFMS